jgi:MFS family permease
VHNAAELLRHRNFTLLFAGRCVSFLGNAMAPVALAFAILELSDSPSALGYVLAARMAPQVLFLVAGGVLADRLPRSAVLVGSNVLAGLSQATVALLLLTGHAEVWHIAVLEAVNGVAFALFYPADASVVPLTVPAELRQDANAVLRLGTNMTLILGAVIAGALVAAFNPGWTVAIDATTFLVAAALLVNMRGIQAATASGTNFFADLVAGWSEFTAHRWIWTIVIQFSLMLVGYYAAFMVLGPVIADRELGGAGAWAAILAGQSAGLILGGLVALRWRPRRPIFIATFCAFASALPIAGLALGLPVAAIVATTIINGIAMEMFGVLWVTALHDHVAPEALARVASYDALGSIALSPLGFVAAGPVSAWLGITPTLWLGAAFVVVPTALVLLVPEVRNLPALHRNPSPPTSAPAPQPADL